MKFPGTHILHFSSFLSSLKTRKDLPENISLFQEKINYRFQNPSLLIQAITHRSVCEEYEDCYERLEFLGDSILEFIVSEYLFLEFPEFSEGELTNRRALIVNKDTLHKYALEMGLPEIVRVDPNVDMNNLPTQKGILSDVVEALIGAITLDGGIDYARKFIHKCILNDHLKELKLRNFNFKGQLFEYCQKRGMGVPIFHVIDVQGPAHRPVYRIAAMVKGKQLGIGKGYSKKSAEQNASSQALKILRQKNIPPTIS